MYFYPSLLVCAVLWPLSSKLTVLLFSAFKWRIGSIPDSIYYLDGLQCLDLRYNQLGGHIPSSIGQLTSLTMLHLHCNRLTSTIPTTFSQLVNLKHLDLRSNQLSGEFPAYFRTMRQLVYVGTKSNKFRYDARAEALNMPWCRIVS
jgi:hypothetical protein